MTAVVTNSTPKKNDSGPYVHEAQLTLQPNSTNYDVALR
jgi:hypothetical protein